MFTDSVLGVHIWQLWIILLSLTLFIMIKQKVKYIFLLLILLSFHQQKDISIDYHLSTIDLINTNIDQDKKWDEQNKKWEEQNKKLKEEWMEYGYMSNDVVSLFKKFEEISKNLCKTY